ncbi:hypothetical protein [Methanococcus maripaludis]|nr:hypothetical protein [Methanococcus maripaludis]
MKCRSGTYVAFNGCGTTNPTEIDRKYFQILKEWNNSEDMV